MNRKDLFGKVLGWIVVCVIVFFTVNSVYAGTPIKITSPLDNDTFYPGDQVLVKIEAPDNSSILITSGTGGVGLIDKAPYEFNFTIPKDAALGKISILAGGVGDKSFIGSDEISINVKLSDKSGIEMTDIRIHPEEEPLNLFLVEVSKTREWIPIEVRGIFSDGATRDITSRESGTQYESSDNSIFFVTDQDGQVMLCPVNIGEAFLTVSNGSFSKKIKIRVLKS